MYTSFCEYKGIHKDVYSQVNEWTRMNTCVEMFILSVWMYVYKYICTFLCTCKFMFTSELSECVCVCMCVCMVFEMNTRPLFMSRYNVINLVTCCSRQLKYNVKYNGHFILSSAVQGLFNVPIPMMNSLHYTKAKLLNTATIPHYNALSTTKLSD